jgi:RES domain-containing protein
MADSASEPGVQELFDAIAGCAKRAVSFQGDVMRSVSMRHANATEIFSGKGAAARGGRWNPRGLEAIYASASVITAVREAYQELLRHGFSASSARPRVFCGARVKLQNGLDLTDKMIRRAIGFTLAELVDENWLAIQQGGQESWTQAIGRGAFEAGLEGLIVPSARDRPNGKNLVIFPTNLRRGSRINVIGKEDLPAHPANPE